MTSLAPTRAPSRLSLPLQAELDETAIGAAIMALEDRPWPCRALDAQLYQAIGWRVVQDRTARRATWRCRSPLQVRWQPLPIPSACQHAAAQLVPWDWSYGAGSRGGQPFAWAALRWPLREGVPFFEASGATPALALCRAALFAHRWIAMQRSACA